VSCAYIIWRVCSVSPPVNCLVLIATCKPPMADQVSSVSPRTFLTANSTPRDDLGDVLESAVWPVRDRTGSAPVRYDPSTATRRTPTTTAFGADRRVEDKLGIVPSDSTGAEAPVSNG
jgi:hypothetical protein